MHSYPTFYYYYTYIYISNYMYNIITFSRYSIGKTFLNINITVQRVNSVFNFTKIEAILRLLNIIYTIRWISFEISRIFQNTNLSIQD